MHHQNITINIHHQKQDTTLCLSNDITLHQLCHQHLKNIPTISSPTHQLIFKLLLNRPPRTLISPGNSDEKTLLSLGLNHTDASHKIILITTPTSELEKSKQISQFEIQRQVARQESLMKKTIKVRDTSRDNLNSESLTYRFHHVSIVQDDHLPHAKRRLDLLKSLSNHPSIQKQLIRFNLSVLHLGELHPSNNPNLLGLNINSGQSIRLRLLTDDLLSVRPFSMVRKVLAHELAHNRFGPHNNQFKEFNSMIYKGMIEYDSSLKASTYRLGGTADSYYQPEEERCEIEAHCQTLSGIETNQTTGTLNQSDHQVLSDLDPRLAAANAAFKRAANQPKK